MRFWILTVFIVIISLIPMACNSSRSTTDTVFLTQNQWILVELDGQPVIHPGTNRQAYLEFTADGNKVTGLTGCNRLLGTYKLSGDENIKFTKIGSTRMACSDMNTENAFLNALDSTNAYGISGKELLLKHDEAVIARLRAEPSH